MWLIIAFILLLGIAPSVCASVSENDTIIALEGVEIHSEKLDIFSGSSKIQTLDTNILNNNYNPDLASILSIYTPVSVKSYGPGVLATTSLRGGSSSHTAFIWNGFNLQSPMNAQNDFSLIPSVFADEIMVQYGGGSAIWGTSAVGGAVIMNNKPDFGKGYRVRYNGTVTTNEDFQNSIKTQWSNNVFATSLRFFHNQANNRYRYINDRKPANPEEKQKHAGYDGWGILQENYFKPHNDHIISLNTWYQQYNRTIPPNLFEEKWQAIQNDNNLRLATRWQGLFDNFRVDLKTGYFEDYIHYKDKNLIDTESRSQMQTSDAELRYYLLGQSTVSLALNHQYLRADVDNYSSKPSEHRYTFMASWNWRNKSESFITSLNFRQKFSKEYDVEPTPDLGLIYKPFKNFAVSVNIGNNYRLPSLNDRYWSPGGNPDLEPESGWSQDINFEISEILSYQSDSNSSTSFNLDKLSLAFFHRKMTNWITWVPGEGGLWSPRNIREVRSYGTETNKKLSYGFGNLNLNATLFYSLTKSVNEKTESSSDATIGKQLTYTPEHEAGVIINLSKGAYSLSYNHNYTGKRYTIGDNSRWLKPYTLADLRIAYDREIMTLNTSFFIKVHNIFDQSYEIMQARPMPLRYFRTGIVINYSQY